MILFALAFVLAVLVVLALVAAAGTAILYHLTVRLEGGFAVVGAVDDAFFGVVSGIGPKGAAIDFSVNGSVRTYACEVDLVRSLDLHDGDLVEGQVVFEKGVYMLRITRKESGDFKDVRPGELMEVDR